MTGVFEVYIKRPKEGEVVIPPPKGEMEIRMPDMKDYEKFTFERILDGVELPQEIVRTLYEWWWSANFCEEFIIRCDLPV